MQARILFWLAVAMAVTGMYSPEGNLYYFLAVHSSMLMIGCSLQRREKRARNPAAAKTASAKPSSAASQAKTG